MLAEQLTLDAADGSDVVYKLIKSSANGTTRIDMATNLTAPGLLEIKHETRGRAPSQVDRHLVSLTRTVIDPTGTPVACTVNLTVSVPRNPAVTSAIVRNLVANMIDFMSDGSIASMATTANVDALLRGES
jgi:hypothetical protein